MPRRPQQHLTPVFQGMTFQGGRPVLLFRMGADHGRADLTLAGPLYRLSVPDDVVLDEDFCAWANDRWTNRQAEDLRVLAHEGLDVDAPLPGM